MFWFFNSKKGLERLEKDVKDSFYKVKDDLEHTGRWIKHLDSQDKQLFDVLSELKKDLSSVKDEIGGLKEAVSMMGFVEENKQLAIKQTAVYKQPAVEVVQNAVQTPVQTANFYEILHGLSTNERLLVFTLMNAGEGMKLSYEDLARLLGKERSTVRGQINAIKQKSGGLIREIREVNGKKRIFVDEEARQKLLKYAKVRVRGKRKTRKSA